MRRANTLILVPLLLLAGCAGPTATERGASDVCASELVPGGSEGRSVEVHVGNERAEEACVRVLLDGALRLVETVPSSGNLPGQYESLGRLRASGSSVEVVVEDARSGLRASERFPLAQENHLVIHVYGSRIDLEMSEDAPAFQ